MAVISLSHYMRSRDFSFFSHSISIFTQHHDFLRVVHLPHSWKMKPQKVSKIIISCLRCLFFSLTSPFLLWKLAVTRGCQRCRVIILFQVLPVFQGKKKKKKKNVIISTWNRMRTQKEKKAKEKGKSGERETHKKWKGRRRNLIYRVEILFEIFENPDETRSSAGYW